MMKIADWLTKASTSLSEADIPTARLDCLVLLEDATGKNRAYLLAHDDDILPDNLVTKLDKAIVQRRQHTPLAYIRQKTEFYKRTFYINNHVLEPRPESEMIIELLAKEQAIEKIIDVGCGSGALAITAKREHPNSRVLAIDIDPKCLAVTRINSEARAADITIQQGNLLENVEPDFIHGAHIIANLPYVPDNFTLNDAALNEPKQAIFGGPDGLDLYRQFFTQLQGTQPAAIFCESLPIQHQTLSDIAEDHNFKLSTTQDFIQVFRP